MTDPAAALAELLGGLRRWPDAEDPTLVAVDATDRLLLDTAALEGATVLTVDDRYGALSLGALALGAGTVLAHQDSIVAERALAANAEAAGLAGRTRTVDLDDPALGAVEVVLWQLPRSLDRLDDVARRLSRVLPSAATVFGGGRLKHMTPAMNDVLRGPFGRVDVSHARQKSRLLLARDPHPTPDLPLGVAEHDGLRIALAPGVFAGGRLDIGTRALLAVLPELRVDAATAVDLGCGSGILAAALARRHPAVQVIATDVSAAAVAAARRTAELTGVGNVTVLRDDAGSSIPDASVDLVLLNPPFHTEGTVHTGVASKLFAAAARMLRPGGELVTVFNSSLGYRAELERVVGMTRQLSRGPKFTVTGSVRG